MEKINELTELNVALNNLNITLNKMIKRRDNEIEKLKSELDRRSHVGHNRRLSGKAEGGDVGITIIREDGFCLEFYVIGNFEPVLPVELMRPAFIGDLFSDSVVVAFREMLSEVKLTGSSNKYHVVHYANGKIRSVDLRLIPTKFADIFIIVAENHSPKMLPAFSAPEF